MTRTRPLTRRSVPSRAGLELCLPQLAAPAKLPELLKPRETARETNRSDKASSVSVNPLTTG